ncbi:LysR substrate-binding domain-containing protein [Streptomyces sp. NPDC048277]|uniref:LysR substrate-binding domain-containing protein n=1 Tax=Streptomyces sp. NPDC048277 TaxID=3155027 RepID=UPI0034037AD1
MRSASARASANRAASVRHLTSVRTARREHVAGTPQKPVDEPFLALPRSAGPLRDHWLALDARAGRPPRIGAEIAGAEETYEALIAGLGICLVAAGNAPLITRGGVTTRPVRGIGAGRYALAWRREDAHRPLVRAYAEACRAMVTG